MARSAPPALRRSNPAGTLLVEVVSIMGASPTVAPGFVRGSTSPLVLLRYLARYGPRTVARKGLGRFRQGRNQRVSRCGVGVVVDGWAPGVAVGEQVLFVEQCVHPDDPYAVLKEGDFARADDIVSNTGADIAEVLDAATALYSSERALIRDQQWGAVRQAPGQPMLRPTSLRSTTHRRATEFDTRPRASIFGWGQYQESVAWPMLAPYVSLSVVHDIDPERLERAGGAATVTTEPVPIADDDESEVWIVSGYHHLHASLAAAGLARGKQVILDKPPIVTREQAHALADATASSEGRLCLAFQRRFSEFHQVAKRVAGAGPIDYTAAVFEIPLPETHWYHWPNSGGAFLRNGCHWIDEFVCLVSACEFTVDYADERDTGGVAVVSASDGSRMTLHLSNRGDPSIGMRNRVSVHGSGESVHAIDDTRFRHDGGAVAGARNFREGRLVPFREMYRTMLAPDGPRQVEEPVESLCRLNELLLQLEAAARC